MTTDTQINNIDRRWLMLAVIFIASLTYAISLQCIPPILTLMISDLNLSFAQAGLIMSLFSIPGIFLSIPIGLLADRYKQKTLITIAFLLILVGTAMVASGNSLLIISIGRIIMGIGGMSINILVPRVLSQWFAGREIGIAMGIYTTGMPLGTIISMNFFSFLGETYGWRISTWFSAGLTLVILLIFVILYTEFKTTHSADEPAPQNVMKDIKGVGTPVWLMGFAWLFFNATMISLFTFTPGLAESSGFNIASSGFITSAIMWPALILSPALGLIIDKIGRTRTIIISGGIILTILIGLVPSTISLILIMMVLIGIVQAMIPGPLYALAADIISPQKLGISYGILSTFANIGATLGPAIIGFMKDSTGSYQISYFMIMFFAFLNVVIMISLVLQCKRKQSVTQNSCN